MSTASQHVKRFKPAVPSTPLSKHILKQKQKHHFQNKNTTTSSCKTFWRKALIKKN